MDIYPIDDTPVIDVHACEINDNSFKYRCNCKQRYHVHGNCGDFSSRMERRSSHCPNFEGDVCIYITDKTIRNRKT